MYESIVPFLACPTCRAALRLAARTSNPNGGVLEGIAACANGHAWPVEGGVLVVTRDDAPSDPWSRTFTDYSKYLAAQDRWVAPSRDNVLPIYGGLRLSQSDNLIDLCTGQGALLFNLLKDVRDSIDILSVDMSFTIQQHNRQFCQERFPDHRVSFISCDVTQLPIRDASFRHAIAFAMGNMMEKLPKGILEASRILARAGEFLFNHMSVQEDSKGWQLYRDYMTKNGVIDFGYVGLEPDFRALLDRSGFSSYTITKTKELIGDPDRDIQAGPLFPYPNEYMAELLVRCLK